RLHSLNVEFSVLGGRNLPLIKVFEHE
ncbi:hypothetical protein BN1044_03330, partial [Hafnia alvei]